MSYSESSAAKVRADSPVPHGMPSAQQLQSFSEKQLEELLRAVQRRLGTSHEGPGDFDYARTVAHELNNVLTVSRLKEGLGLDSGQTA